MTASRRRDRRGRGPRGPAVAPGGLGGRVARTSRPHSRRAEFDRLVVEVVTEVEERWSERLGLVESAVEEAPAVPDDWESVSVPLASLVRGSGSRPSRLVVYRRPVEHRCENRADLATLVLTVLVEQVAELLGVAPEDVHPDYRGDDLDEGGAR